MSIEPPSARAIQEIAQGFGITLSGDDAEAFVTCMGGIVDAYRRLDAMPDPQRPTTFPRDPGHAPAAADNPYNAWAWRCHIEGTPGGVLSGKTVGIKDNVCVADMPARNGSNVLNGFVPRQDATIVTRILEAGGTIVGKTTCENLSFSGHSHTSTPAPVLNPHKPDHSAGGSSSGSGAAIVAKDVPMAIGGDQGGSVRIPASWCGVYGLKPTHGLVPYTGIYTIEASIDHCGPMADTVEDCARLLSAIAGPDGLDPRQRDAVVGDYLNALDRPLKGLRIAAIQEGFDRPDSEAATDDKVRLALDAMRTAGATVDEVSLPAHLDMFAIFAPILAEGCSELMFGANGMAGHSEGFYSLEMIDAFAKWRQRSADVPVTAAMVLFIGSYMNRTYQGRYFAKAQALRGSVRAQYDRVLGDYDLLAMPTIPFRATPFPSPDATLREVLEVALSMTGNTAPINASGHPAISLPCGMHDGLPIGLMLIGKTWDDATVLGAAAGFEQLGDWRSM